MLFTRLALIVLLAFIFVAKCEIGDENAIGKPQPMTMNQSSSIQFMSNNDDPPHLNLIANNQKETNQHLNIYTIVSIVTAGLVCIAFMVTTIILYKIRINYLLERQLNQFRRIDAQLRLDDLNEFYRVKL